MHNLTQSNEPIQYVAPPVMQAAEQLAVPLHTVASTQEDLVQRQLDILAAESRNKKRAKRKYIFKTVAVTVILIVCLMNYHHLYFYNIWWMFGGAAGYKGFKAMTDAQNRAAASLAAQEDIRAVGPMIEMLALDARYSERQLIEGYLVRMLPRLKESDSTLITAEQRGKLYDYLLGKAGAVNETVTVAMLDALKQVGDARSVEVVERISAGQVAADYSSRVLAAATECLPYLRDLQVRREAAQTLLRGSSSTASDSTGLLRPVTGAGNDSSPDELVRSSSAEAS